MSLRLAVLLPTMLLATTSPAPSHSSMRVAPPVVTVRATEFAFVAPKTIKSGPTTFHLVNGGKELHHMSIVKLGAGKTMKDVVEAMKKQGPPPAWMTDVGGPNPAAPGGSVDATLLLEPGEYAFLCFINSPGDPTPHMAKGMMGSFTVLPEANGASMPDADVAMTLSDYKFTASKPLTAGKHVINVVNTASQTHEIVLVKFHAGKKMADLVQYVEKDMMKGPPPAETISGIAGIAKGRSATFPVDLKPGNYGMLCFVPDAKDGKSHAAHGMVTEFVVK